MKISAVIPCYGAPNSLPELHARLVSAFHSMSCQYEIIFVNDCCPRNSWAQIQTLCAADPHVKGINFVRNFGQHSAISAGLESATGDWICVMDCDLQDDPAYIAKFYEASKQGVDVILALRMQRHERFFKRLQSWIFYKFLTVFLGINMDHRVGNFGLYSKRTIDATKLLKDRTRFFPYLISWLKFPTVRVDITQNKRDEGQSSYTFKKALELAFKVAISSSDRPLMWSVQIGAVCAITSFSLALVFVGRYFFLGLAPSGWTSLIVTIFFSTGLILLNLGIVGLYLAQVHEQSKERPTYIIGERLNL